MSARPQSFDGSHDVGDVTISPRQAEVLDLLAEGFSEREIAERLDIAPRTVRMHCDVLRAKLGVERRRQLPAAFRRVVARDNDALE